MKFPADFRAFVSLYGDGFIDGFLCVFNPFSVNRFVNFEEQMHARLLALREHHASIGEALPYPLFPAPAGLVPLGTTDNGDVMYWETKGQPDDWTVLIQESRLAEFDCFNGGMVEFLQRVLAKEFSSSVFPEDFPSDTPQFTSRH